MNEDKKESNNNFLDPSNDKAVRIFGITTICINILFYSVIGYAIYYFFIK